MQSSGWSILAKEFTDNGTRIEYRKDEIVIRPEIDTPGVFFVESGYLKVYQLTKSGNENITNFKQPHSLLPFLWAITGESRGHYFQAITDVVAYRLSRESFGHFLDSHPESAKQAMVKLVYLYDEYADRIHSLEFRYASERIAYHLLSLASQYGTKKGSKIHINLPIKQIELADSVNVTRETASKELSKLKKKGLIEYKDSKYTILDKSALKSLY